MNKKYTLISISILTALYSQQSLADLHSQCLLGVPHFTGVVVKGDVNNLPVYIDKNAYRADGIIIFNRVKMHTSFRGKYESGLIKMLSIGLGKRKGADAIHAERFEHMADNILACAKVSLEKLNIIGGVCTIENGYDEVADIFVLDKNEILQKEPQILQKSKSLMPRIYLDDIDVLIVKKISKNISVTDMDTNIIVKLNTKKMNSILKICFFNLYSPFFIYILYGLIIT